LQPSLSISAGFENFKDMERIGMRRKPAIMIALTYALLCFSIAAFAQTEEETAPPVTDNQTSASRPEPRPELNPERRLSQRPAGDINNHFGFSLGILGWYDSNVSGSTTKEAMSAISPNPKFFVNLSTRKTVLHLDYEFLYRYYPDKSNQDSQLHEGGVELIHQLSRNTTFSFQDSIRSGPNDILSSTSSNNIISSSGQLQVFFDQQKMLQNSLSGSLAYQNPRNRNSLSIDSYYYTYRYDSKPDQNTDSVSFHAIDNFRVSKQWFIVGDFSNEWINSATNSRDGTILRYMGGLAYRPTKNWEMAFKAGGERVSLVSYNQGITYAANATHKTKLNRLDIRYQHQSGYQIGLVDLNKYHSLIGTFDQQLSSRISINFMSSFYRTNTAAFGHVNTLGGGGGFDFALHPSLTASISGNYVYQQSSYPLLDKSLHTDRYMLYAGLQYLFPSIRRQPRGAYNGR